MMNGCYGETHGTLDDVHTQHMENNRITAPNQKQKAWLSYCDQTTVGGAIEAATVATAAAAVEVATPFSI